MSGRGVMAQMLVGVLVGLMPSAEAAVDEPGAHTKKLTKAERFAAELRELPDGELRQRFADTGLDDRSRYEACLTEILHREKTFWEPVLQDRLKTIMDRWSAESLPDHIENNLCFFDNLETLTALRRLQGRPDPLTIRILGEEPLTCSFPDTLSIPVAFINMDVGRVPVRLWVGALPECPFERWPRWRINVHCDDGSLLPIHRPPLEAMPSMGMAVILGFGERIKTVYHLGTYVDRLEPGEYAVWVEYHDLIELTDERKETGLIISRSLPSSVTVKPRFIDVTVEENRQAEQLLASLDESSQPCIVMGLPPGIVPPDADPEAPATRLMAMGWKAVPTLGGTLKTEGLSPRKRAWVLTLLYSITGQQDPDQVNGVMPDHTYRTFWMPGKQMSGGAAVILGGGGHGFRKGTIDPEKQRAFAAEWIDWFQKGFIRARPKPDPHVSVTP